MNNQHSYNQLGYYSRSFGWVESNNNSKSKIDILNSTFLQEKYRNLDVDIILLRRPRIDAVETEYKNHVIMTTGIVGASVFDFANDWRELEYLTSNKPFADGTYNSLLDRNIMESSNVPVKMRYGNEIIRTKRNVSIKLKKIDFNSLSFPSGLSLLQEFVEYIKNGNKRSYDGSTNFISVLNAAVITSKTMPTVEAKMLFDDNIVTEKKYSNKLTHVEPSENSTVISMISKAVFNLVTSVYEPAEKALNAVLTVGGLINSITNATDMEVLFGNEKIPNGTIIEYKVDKDETGIYVTDLDYIYLYHSLSYPTPFTRTAETSVVSNTKIVHESPTCLLDVVLVNVTSIFASHITKTLLKNVRPDTTTFFRTLVTDNFPQGLGHNGFILAGDVLNPDIGTLSACNYKSYTHTSFDTFQNRLYCQYKFNLNLRELTEQFSAPGEIGDWSNGPGFNSIWIDDMPFGFFVDTPSGGEWYYTRYATDIPYTD